ncbi:MAG: helix-turn-helix transcriptional regulator, partial [Clostridia bacterium]|nr:helix-turn-helix transcriptional regulator [Clostridia bacterium]
MKHPDPRGTLIQRTVQVIAEQGLDKTTTKAVVRDSGINEAYIYRYFEDKEDLLVQTFRTLDEELLQVTMANVPDVCDGTVSYEEHYRRFFTATWR